MQWSPRSIQWWGIAVLIGGFAITGVWGVVDGGAEGPETAPIRVMAFNLRYARMTGKHSWLRRAPAVQQVIERHAPDLIGTQEGLYPQLQSLAARIPDYRWIGLGREGGSRGEFMAVFYRAARFTPLEFDHFWLSDTPDTIGSKGWGNNVVRMVTWVRFRDRETGRDLVLINTHFDHESQPSREKSAALLAKRIGEIAAESRVIVTGDFNADAATNPVHARLLEAGLVDTWESAKSRSKQYATYHGYREPTLDGPRIDWILTGPGWRCTRAEIVIDRPELDGEAVYPSDHFPVTAILE